MGQQGDLDFCVGKQKKINLVQDIQGKVGRRAPNSRIYYQQSSEDNWETFLKLYPEFSNNDMISKEATSRHRDRLEKWGCIFVILEQNGSWDLAAEIRLCRKK